jgi:hypothetical protein
MSMVMVVLLQVGMELQSTLVAMAETLRERASLVVGVKEQPVQQMVIMVVRQTLGLVALVQEMGEMEVMEEVA